MSALMAPIALCPQCLRSSGSQLQLKVTDETVGSDEWIPNFDEILIESQQICKLFTEYLLTEAKMVKFHLLKMSLNNKKLKILVNPKYF